jgi:hypothetical protein
MLSRLSLGAKERATGSCGGVSGRDGGDRCCFQGDWSQGFFPYLGIFKKFFLFLATLQDQTYVVPQVFPLDKEKLMRVSTTERQSWIVWLFVFFLKKLVDEARLLNGKGGTLSSDENKRLEGVLAEIKAMAPNLHFNLVPAQFSHTLCLPSLMRTLKSQFPQAASPAIWKNGFFGILGQLFFL